MNIQEVARKSSGNVRRSLGLRCSSGDSVTFLSEMVNWSADTDFD